MEMDDEPLSDPDPIPEAPPDKPARVSSFDRFYEQLSSLANYEAIDPPETLRVETLHLLEVVAARLRGTDEFLRSASVDAERLEGGNREVVWGGWQIVTPRDCEWVGSARLRTGREEAAELRKKGPIPSSPSHDRGNAR